MKSQIITIRINFDPDKNEDEPANWNWPMMLGGAASEVTGFNPPQEALGVSTDEVAANAKRVEIIDTETRWIHEDCGQVVAEDESGYYHIENLKQCVTLGGAFPDFGLKVVEHE